MNLFSILLSILGIYIALGLLGIIIGYAVVYFIKPWCPGLWEQHICAPDPEEVQFMRLSGSTALVESLQPNG